MAWALAGYALFGVGYIGYMTFSIPLLREQGLSSTGVTVYYTLLGAAVVAAPRLWASLLDRERGQEGEGDDELRALQDVHVWTSVLRDPWRVRSGGAWTR